MQGLQQYLMDAYGIYCASALASTIVLRCVVAAIFPMISPVMFQNLGDQWACSVFAFLALTCTPLPFLFYVSGLVDYCVSVSLRKDSFNDRDTGPGSANIPNLHSKIARFMVSLQKHRRAPLFQMKKCRANLPSCCTFTFVYPIICYQIRDAIRLRMEYHMRTLNHCNFHNGCASCDD